MSYGTDIADSSSSRRHAGSILKGARPADAGRAGKQVRAGNARMLGLTVQPTLLATADEVVG